MRHLRRLLLRSAAVLGSLAAFVGAGYLAGGYFLDHENRVQLSQLNRFVLGRAELEADFAFIALGDLAEAGTAGCQPELLREMRRQVYLRSTVKDIRVLDAAGRVLCSAFPETLGFDATSAAPVAASPARNTDIRLFRLEQQSNAALGVLWQAEADLSLVAVLNTDALLFDVLPKELRDHSDLYLTLPDGAVVAASVRRAEPEPERRATVDFEARSERYPLTVKLRVDADALSSWNRGPERYFVVLGALLGLVFGLLVARMLVPPRTPLAELDEALASGEFVPFAQPVFSLDTGAITGCEILARWVRRDGTTVSPYRFIPLAEESGRIAALTRQMVADSLSELQSLLNRDAGLTVAFNVSPDHFQSAAFVTEMHDLVHRAGVSPRQVILEITERQQLQDLAAAAGLIARLVECGFQVAIDDAGSGHSGLSYLQKLGVQIIKIDKLFIDAVESDHSARVIIEMLVRTAHELAVAVVAEGIERAEQLSWLREIGVDHGQGFLVSAPVPIREFRALVGATATSTAFEREAGLPSLVA